MILESNYRHRRKRDGCYDIEEACVEFKTVEEQMISLTNEVECKDEELGKRRASLKSQSQRRHNFRKHFYCNTIKRTEY